MANTVVIVLKGDAQQLINTLNKSGQAVKGWEKTAESGSKKTAAMGGSMAELGRSLIAPLAFTALAAGAKQWADESEALGRNFITQKNLLTNLLGSTSAYNQAMTDAATATMGMVNQGELAQSTFLLMKSGLAESGAEAGKLALVGQVMSKTYEASGASFDKFLRLLQSGSQILLDNFALTKGEVDVRKAQIEATGQLSGEEAKLLAIKQLVVEEGERTLAAMSSEQKTLELDAAYKNLQTTVGGNLLPAYNSLREVQYDIVKGLGDSIGDISKYVELMGMLSGETGKAGENSRTWGDTLVSVVFPLADTEALGDSLTSMTHWLIENTIGWEALGEKMGMSRDVQSELTDQIKISTEAESEYKSSLLETIAAHNQYAIGMTGMVFKLQDLNKQRLAHASSYQEELAKIEAKGQQEITKINKQEEKEKTVAIDVWEERRKQLIKNATMFTKGELENRLHDLELKKLGAVSLAETEAEDLRKIQDQQIADEKKARSLALDEEAKEQKKHAQELIVQMALARLEVAGKLEEITGISGATSEQLFAAYQTGQIKLNDSTLSEVGRMGSQFEADRHALWINQENNSTRVAKAIEAAAAKGTDAYTESFITIDENAATTKVAIQDAFDEKVPQDYARQMGISVDTIVDKQRIWQQEAQKTKRIQDELTISIGLANSAAAKSTSRGYAAGGTFTVPPGYPNDSYMAGFTSGETVSVQPTQNISNFNLNMSSSQSSGRLSQDFQMMSITSKMMN